MDGQGKVLAYEQSWMKGVLTTPWEKTARLKCEVADMNRVRVINYMTARLVEILQLVNERKFH